MIMSNNILDRLQDAYDISIESATVLGKVLEELFDIDKSLAQLLGDKRLSEFGVSDKIKLTKAILHIASLVEENNE